MSNQSVLIIDDEPDIRELLGIALSRMGLTVTTKATLSEARRALASDRFNLCLTDMRLPDGNGLDLIQEISRNHPELPAAVITAHGKVEDAVTALKAGAFDFLSKPVDLQDLRNLVNTALRLSAGPSKSKPAGQPDSLPQNHLIGHSEPMQQLRSMITKLSRSQAPVFISGASGSGKELAAKLIHQLGPRSEQAFVPVNCGAIPSELMESEFFGHKKGSFTGADRDKQGLFQVANGGTLFLDEVVDLPLHMQVKLLRVIQEKAVRPIGSQREIPINVRILSASHKSLLAAVDASEFRNDLYFRLNVIELNMPDLASRREDIPLLAEHFLKHLSAEAGLEQPMRLSEDALLALTSHRYDGNVRELINILQRAMALCDGDRITRPDLQLQGHTREPPPSVSPASGRAHGQSLDHYLESIEKDMLEEAMEACRYNKTAAAEYLGISFRSLRYKLKKYGIS